MATEFLATIKGRPEPWISLFPAWALERDLSEPEARAVRVEVIRARVFGAVERRRA